MKTLRVIVRWPQGLHARPACQLVRMASGFRSAVRLRVGDRVADARSMLALLMLCATLGTPIDVEASGEDEEAAVQAVAGLFSATQR